MMHPSVVAELDALLVDLDRFIVDDGGIFDEPAMDRFRERIARARWHLKGEPACPAPICPS